MSSEVIGNLTGYVELVNGTGDLSDENAVIYRNGPSVPRVLEQLEINDATYDTETIQTNISITECVRNNEEKSVTGEKPIEVELQLGDEEVAVGEVGGESDAHLPRVRVELDRLNYANESINNLELELVEAKREFLEVLRYSESELEACEKKIGNQHVQKSVVYYEERMALNLAKQKYLNAKFRFETAQELYVAAKNVQMYAEENLEDGKEAGSVDSVSESMNLVKMHKMAKVKVSEAEFSKQSCDLEQIESFKVYDVTLKRVEQTEKRLKSSIAKSIKYFQMKSAFNKELQFFSLKIDGLKSCLREAKTTYQQSLRNLEKISTEVHLQRSFNKAHNASNSSLHHRSTSPSSSTSSISSVSNPVTSHSSPNLTTIRSHSCPDEFASNSRLHSKSNSLSTLIEAKQLASSKGDETEEEEEEDYDKIFNESILKSESERSFTRTFVHYSQKLDKNAVCLLTDEEIENLRLDKKVKKFENELLNRKAPEAVRVDQSNTSGNVDGGAAVVSSRPSQFRISFFSKS